MNIKPAYLEINHHTIKLIIGVMALSLALLTNLFASQPLESISASYYEGDWSRNIFVGFLFAISAFLLAYNGRSEKEMIISKIAAFAAMGVAMFPCSCGGHPEIVPYVHNISAATMFIILSIFCYFFYKRAKEKRYVQSKIRSYIYKACGLIIVASISILVMDFFLKGAISSKVIRLTFYCEAAGLIAFGVAWLVASRMLPFITNKEERLSISPGKKNSYSL